MQTTRLSTSGGRDGPLDYPNGEERVVGAARRSPAAANLSSPSPAVSDGGSSSSGGGGVAPVPRWGQRRSPGIRYPPGATVARSHEEWMRPSYLLQHQRQGHDAASQSLPPSPQQQQQQQQQKDSADGGRRSAAPGFLASWLSFLAPGEEGDGATAAFNAAAGGGPSAPVAVDTAAPMDRVVGRYQELAWQLQCWRLSGVRTAGTDGPQATAVAVSSPPWRGASGTAGEARRRVEGTPTGQQVGRLPHHKQQQQRWRRWLSSLTRQIDPIRVAGDVGSSSGGGGGRGGPVPLPLLPAASTPRQRRHDVSVSFRDSYLDDGAVTASVSGGGARASSVLQRSDVVAATAAAAAGEVAPTSAAVVEEEEEALDSGESDASGDDAELASVYSATSSLSSTESNPTDSTGRAASATAGEGVMQRLWDQLRGGCAARQSRRRRRAGKGSSRGSRPVVGRGRGGDRIVFPFDEGWSVAVQRRLRERAPTAWERPLSFLTALSQQPQPTLPRGWWGATPPQRSRSTTTESSTATTSGSSGGDCAEAAAGAVSTHSRLASLLTTMEECCQRHMDGEGEEARGGASSPHQPCSSSRNADRAAAADGPAVGEGEVQDGKAPAEESAVDGAPTLPSLSLSHSIVSSRPFERRRADTCDFTLAGRTSGDAQQRHVSLLTETVRTSRDAAVRGVYGDLVTSTLTGIVQRAVTGRLNALKGVADRLYSEEVLRAVLSAVGQGGASATKPKMSRDYGSSSGSSRAGGGGGGATASAAGAPPRILFRGVLRHIAEGRPASIAALATDADDDAVLGRIAAKAGSHEVALSFAASIPPHVEQQRQRRLAAVSKVGKAAAACAASPAVVSTAYSPMSFAQLASLQPRTWLNDQVINNYLQLLCEDAAYRAGGVDVVATLGTHFYTKVEGEIAALVGAGGAGAGADQQQQQLPPLPAGHTLLRWLRRRSHLLLPHRAHTDISASSHSGGSSSPPPPPRATTTVHTVLVPVNLYDQHWALAAWDKRTGAWCFYDSLHGSAGRPHRRGARVLRELSHVIAECRRHLCPEAHAAAVAAAPGGRRVVALPTSTDAAAAAGRAPPTPAEAAAFMATRLPRLPRRLRDAFEADEEGRLLGAPAAKRHRCAAPKGSDDDDDDDSGAAAATELSEADVFWFSPGHRTMPQQRNGDDCGVFVCQASWCLAQGVAVAFAADEIATLRRVITLELWARRLLQRLPTAHAPSSVTVCVALDRHAAKHKGDRDDEEDEGLIKKKKLL